MVTYSNGDAAWRAAVCKINMPSYNFKCENCKKEVKKEMSISAFLNERKSVTCSCSGNMKQIIIPSTNKIDRDADTVVAEAKEEARVLMDKINNGDEQAFIDVYGDKENKYNR